MLITKQKLLPVNKTNSQITKQNQQFLQGKMIAMARKPRGQFNTSNYFMLLLSAAVLNLCGCEIGRTMFQYNSGSSSPWVGIDLLPRKKARATKISHKKIVPSPQKHLQEQSLTLQKEPIMSEFRKKPLRLNLPSSKSSDENKKLTSADLKNGSIPISSVVDF